MIQSHAKPDIIRQLKQEICSLEGYGSVSAGQEASAGLGVLERAFPGGVFPTSVIHEFVSSAAGEAAATNGFIAGLLGRLMQAHSACLWVSTGRTVFPPALSAFGISPERIIFVDLKRDTDALWAIEEALKCNALSVVVGELGDVSFAQSRRLQLAVEQSRVTGLLHRRRPGIPGTIAAVTRWKISPIASLPADGLPGIGAPRWSVQLQKVRNGQPGTWQIEWGAEGFRIIPAIKPKTAPLRGRYIQQAG